MLWQRLRRDQLDGLHFRRQHPIGRFVLDFYCPAARLVVELDGGVHVTRRQRDAERTEMLRAGGYWVLRFRNEEVIDNVESVLNRIRSAALKTSSPPPELGGGARGGGLRGRC
jgi:very-short-patch-repair endonuclease